MPSEYVKRRWAEIAAEQAANRAVLPPVVMEIEKPAPDIGHVYFFRAGERVKIGFSSNLPSRVKALQTGSPERGFVCRLVAGGRKVERRFHARFAAYRLQGEWFEVRGRLAKFLEMHVEPADLPAREPEPDIVIRF
jgi:hypothetical protein